MAKGQVQRKVWRRYLVSIGFLWYL